MKVVEKNDRLKETLSHSKQVYEKEIRRARKEAFKASSDNIRLHEELKTSRDAESGVREQLESMKQTVATVEKEAFSARYKLIEVEEELQKMQQNIKVVEEERDALKTSLKEEEVARIAAEGRIPLPVSATPDEFSSPRKKKATPMSTPTPTPKRQSRMIQPDPSSQNLMAAESTIIMLRQQLDEEGKLKKSAEDLVDFMKLECQLKRCCCRRAEDGKAKDYIFDHQFDEVIAKVRKDIERFERSSKSLIAHGDKAKPRRPKRTEPARPKTPSRHIEEDTTAAMEPLIEFSPVTGTFRTIVSPPKPKAEAPSSRPQSSDDHQPKPNTLAPPLAPVTRSESPSILSLAETTGTTAKSPEDNCQILPSTLPEPVPINEPSEPLLPSQPEQTLPPTPATEPEPSTPKQSDHATPRPSDADLLSFTPYNPSTTFPSQYFHQPQQHLSQPATLSAAAARLFPPPPAQLTHSQSYILTKTKTTTIPLADEPSTPSTKTILQNPAFTSGVVVGFSPGTTKTREEALQSIERWRRGRSRSVVVGGTPRRFGGAGGVAGANGGVIGSGENGVGGAAGAGAVGVKDPLTPGKRDCSAPVPRTNREF